MLAALILAPLTATAASVDQLSGQLNQTEGQINQYKVKVEEHQDTATKLEDQLANMRAEAAELEAGIIKIEGQVAVINVRMAERKTVLSQYIKEQYYASNTTPLEILVESESISEFMDDERYIEAGRSKIETILAEIEADKKQLDVQKAELGKQKSALAVQQKAINELLAKTRGEQAKYESLLAKAKASRDRLDAQISALMVSGPQKSYGYVYKGQQIGREGSTGFSTGSHLHFGAYRGGSSNDVSPWGYINSGQWRMPLDDSTVTQDYNAHNCNGVYANCKHNGIDLSAGFGAPIRAAASGNIIMNAWDQYGFGHYIVIDHGNGVWSLYAHMQ